MAALEVVSEDVSIKELKTSVLDVLTAL